MSLDVRGWMMDFAIIHYCRQLGTTYTVLQLSKNGGTEYAWEYVNELYNEEMGILRISCT